MAVTVTWHEHDAEFRMQRRTTVHDDAQSFAADPEGRLFLFDYSPTDVEDSRATSALGHTVALYAVGQWALAVRS